MACDVAALPVVLAGALATKSVAGIVPGLGLFALGPPINHGLHHQPGRVMASLVLRVAALAASYAAVSAVANGNCGGEQPGGNCGALILLGLVGAPLVAMVVDDAFLAVTPDATPPPVTSTASLSPALSVRTNGASLGLTGTF